MLDEPEYADLFASSEVDAVTTLTSTLCDCSKSITQLAETRESVLLGGPNRA